jgi:glycosyltransferase involved in cell wall biosynthesis
LKKIVLVSFYFSPCTLTPSQRLSYWAENFHKLGYYPIVVTRAWDKEIKTHHDTKIAFGEKLRIEQFSTHEVHYLPYSPGILDRAYLHFGENFLRPLFLVIKVLDVFLAGFTLKFTSFSNFQPYLEELIKEQKPEKMIISGEPFYLFRIGYYLNRKLGVSWIADYRDDWSTNELQMQKGGSSFRKWLINLEARYEKKWVSTAQFIISVSESYTKRISSFLSKTGVTVQNGFEESLLEIPPQQLENEFTLMYSGVLYPSQNLSLILGALELAYQEKKPFRLVFLGAGFDVKEKKRIESMVPSYLSDYVEVTTRFPRMVAIEKLQKAHALLGIAYGDMKGIPSSKLYEYLALGKPVLLCPSDGDVMEKILSESKLGFFANTSKEAKSSIDTIRELYLDEQKLSALKENSRNFISPYSRFNQLNELAKHLAN